MADRARKILVVDDDVPLARAFDRCLKSKGYDVTCVHTGSDAKKLIDAVSFDVVVSDISLPGLTGIQLLKSVRERDQDVPVILVTGDPVLDTAMRAVEYGALRYLVKPVELSELVEQVSYGIQLHDLAKAKRQALSLVQGDERERKGLEQLKETFQKALISLWPAFQPIVYHPGRTIYAYEALMRCRDPHLPNPDALLDAAERLNMLLELGRTMRLRVSEQMASHDGDFSVFVNLHPQDLLDEALYSEKSPLARFAERVVLEITERARIDRVDDLESRLARLRGMGYRIALDDMGAGYAGLSSFVQLSPHVVKVDMSLVRGIDHDSARQSAVLSIVRLCSELGAMVVMEGVETAKERRALVALGADYLQGYVFGFPQECFAEVPTTAFG